MKSVYAIQNAKGEIAYLRANSATVIRNTYRGMGFVKNPLNITAIHRVYPKIKIAKLPVLQRGQLAPVIFNSYNHLLTLHDFSPYE